MHPARPEKYKLVRLANGVPSIYSVEHDETFHPVIGPEAEAQALYVRQMRLVERARSSGEPFVIWDVGLGAAANALTAVRALRGIGARIELISFDATLEPLEFGMAHAEQLRYFAGYEGIVEQLLREHTAVIGDGSTKLNWRVLAGDFPTLFEDRQRTALLPKPHVILYDAFSPAKNPEMWTLPHFRNLKKALEPSRPCAMATYSRSTLLRVTWLVAGFFVGAGESTGQKEETTIAANRIGLVPRPLGRAWLLRAKRSASAQPLLRPSYSQQRLSPETWEELAGHDQFRGP